MKKISILMLCTSIAFFSCKKTTLKETVVKGNPKFEVHGTLNGNSYEQTINTNGGTVKMPYNNISIIVPPGAVNKEVIFKIQQIAFPTYDGVELGYRITTDEIELNKEIEVNFKYDDTNLDGTAEDLLYLAQQENSTKGFWHRMINTEIDKQNRILKVNTKKPNGDWMLDKVFWIKSNRSELKEYEVANLEVMTNDIKDFEGYTDLIYFTSSTDDFIDNWSVNGKGVLLDDKKSKNSYKAPLNLTSSITETINVTLSKLNGKVNPSRHNSGTKIILHKSLVVKK